MAPHHLHLLHTLYPATPESWSCFIFRISGICCLHQLCQVHISTPIQAILVSCLPDTSGCPATLPLSAACLRSTLSSIRFPIHSPSFPISPPASLLLTWHVTYFTLRREATHLAFLLFTPDRLILQLPSHLWKSSHARHGRFPQQSLDRAFSWLLRCIGYLLLFGNNTTNLAKNITYLLFLICGSEAPAQLGGVHYTPQSETPHKTSAFFFRSSDGGRDFSKRDATHSLMYYTPPLGHILFFRSKSRACGIPPEGIITGCKRHEAGVTGSHTWVCCIGDLGSSLISCLFRIFTFFQLNIGNSAVSDAWGKHGIKNALGSPTYIIVDNCVSPEQPSFWEEFSHSLKRQLHRTSRLPRYYFTIFFNCRTKV